MGIEPILEAGESAWSAQNGAVGESVRGAADSPWPTEADSTPEDARDSGEAGHCFDSAGPTIPNLTIPTHIPAVLGGSYRVLELLEEGGMGKLYRAEHIRLRRPLAIKVLAEHLVDNQTARYRFHREAEIISRLHHPHVVQILDFDTTEADEPYIVMELLEGETLAARLAREQSLSPSDAVIVVGQVSLALAAAHQAGIVHRDLKPNNIFLVAVEGGSIFAKVLDFGISRTLAETIHVTGEFELLGTPAYMAPEQTGGGSVGDHRTDEYALAAITYEMMTGSQPFLGETVPELLRRLTREAPPPMSAFTDAIPPAVESVVLRGMAKSPADRYPSVAEFAEELASAAGLPALRRSVLPRSVWPRSVWPSHDPEESQLMASLPPSQSLRVAPNWLTAPTQTDLDRLTPLPPPGAMFRRPSTPPATVSVPPYDRLSPIPEPTLPDVEARLAECRQAAAFGEHQRAVTMARSVLRMIRRSADPRCRRIAVEAGPLLEPLLLEAVGGKQAAVASIPEANVKGTHMTPEHAYLLSRVLEPITIDELLDISPLSHAETLSFVLELSADGTLELG